MTETFNEAVLIDGADDVTQLRVQGHTTQNQALQSWENSAGSVLAQVSGDGRVQVGDDVGLASPDALIEAHRDDVSTAKPKRGFHALGRVSDALSNAAQWIVQELEIRGSGNLSALQTALRVRASNMNTGTPASGAELRGADVEVINDAAAGNAALLKATGLQVGITNATGKTITEAVGLKVKLDNAGTITTPYAIFTEGAGVTHLDDYVEMKRPAVTPGTPATDNLRVYSKSDGKLYAKNWSGTEYDLTADVAINSLPVESAPAVDDKLLLYDVSESANNALLLRNIVRPLTYNNLIINGGFDFWQRGTSFAALANGYAADRWSWVATGSGVATISQSMDVPTADDTTPLGNYSLQVAVTTADTSITATDGYRIVHKIEGYHIRNLVGKKLSLSFWVKSPKTGTHCVSFCNTGGNQSYVATYTVNAVNTWEYKTISLQAVVPTAGTWNYTNLIGLYIRFALAMGSDSQTTADAWQTANYFATSAQVNCMDSTSNVFKLFGVCLVEGEMPVPYQTPDFGEEYRRCQRYYQRSYALGTATGTPSARGFSYGYPVSSTAVLLYDTKFPVPTRAIPTMNIYAYDGTANKFGNAATGATVGTGTCGISSGITAEGMEAATDPGAGLTVGTRVLFHWTADAEI